MPDINASSQDAAGIDPVLAAKRSKLQNVIKILKEANKFKPDPKQLKNTNKFFSGFHKKINPHFDAWMTIYRWYQ